MYPHEQLLVDKFKDKPFALLGVNSDRDREKLKEIIQEKKLTWRSFWNGPKGTGGPISEEWAVQGWPTVYIIDHKGVIRYKNPQSTAKGLDYEAIDRAIETLLKEAEADAKGDAK